MGKKVEVVLRNIRAGRIYLIKGHGELIPLEYNDTDIGQISKTAFFMLNIIHIMQNIPGIQSISGPDFSYQVELAKRSVWKILRIESMNIFLMLNDPKRAEFFRTNHEELEHLKTQAISQ